MNQRTQLLLGTSFLFMSGLIYTLERIAANILRAGEMQTGSYATYPPSFIYLLTQNWFIALFGLTGIYLIFKANSARHTETQHEPIR